MIIAANFGPMLNSHIKSKGVVIVALGLVPKIVEV
jgi:hypothetical protein